MKFGMGANIEQKTIYNEFKIATAIIFSISWFPTYAIMLFECFASFYIEIPYNS